MNIDPRRMASVLARMQPVSGPGGQPPQPAPQMMQRPPMPQAGIPQGMPMPQRPSMPRGQTSGPIGGITQNPPPRRF